MSIQNGTERWAKQPTIVLEKIKKLIFFVGWGAGG
jgi:hypothetical protein